MSIVNQMLNDLQQNKQSALVMEGLLASPADEPKIKKVIWLLFVIGSLLLITILTRSYFKQQAILSIPSTIDLSEKIKEVEQSNVIAKEKKVVIKSFDFKTNLNLEITDKKLEETRPFTQPTVISTESNNEKPTKPLIKKDGVELSGKTFKKISKISIAENELARIVKQWQFKSSETSYQNLLLMLNNYPDLPSIWLDSLSFLRTRNTNHYENLLEISIKTFPEKISFSLLSAQYDYSNGQYLKAYQQLNDINNKQKNQRVYQLSGLILQKLGKHQQAIKNYKTLLTIMPDRGEISMAIGISFDALKQPDQATVYFVRALKDRQLSPVQKQFIQQQLTTYQG